MGVSSTIELRGQAGQADPARGSSEAPTRLDGGSDAGILHARPGLPPGNNEREMGANEERRICR